ncbi:MAG: nucleotidyltransferase family protein [Patescibacteria group bacterium]
MQAIILAAGKGTRMGELTKKTPKPMLKINNKPILEYKLNALPEEIKEVIFVIGYLGDVIKNHFGDFYNGRKIRYVIQRELNGSGAAAHLAKDILKDRFLVMMGDDLYHKDDLKNIIKHDLAVLAHEVDDPTQFGIIETNSDGNLINIVEKPKKSANKLANIGVYMLNKKFFNYALAYTDNGETNLPLTIAKMSDNHIIKIEKANHWFAIGYPEDFKKTEKIIYKFV